MASSSIYHYNRKTEKSNCDEDVYSYHITLEQTTSESDADLSDPESIESVQANTTVSAKDSSDISTDELSDFMSEYEVATTSETNDLTSFDKELFSSASSTHDGAVLSPRISQEELIFGCSESESGNGTDFSDNLGSLTDNKFYHSCAQCFSYNANPAFRFCESCYQLRKESYPTKPPKRKRKRTSENHLSKKLKTTPENSASNSNPSEENAESKSSDIISSSLIDSGFESLSPSAEWEIAETQEKCITCLLHDVNGLFLHGKTAHRCCCYECSKRIWCRSKKCPICRREIQNVILLLN